jgi:hypothetical protein
MTPVPTCPAPAGNHITCADGAGPAARSAGPSSPARPSPAQNVAKENHEY